MINPRRRTAKARSSKPLLETDNVDQRVVCTIAIIFLTFEQKVKGKGGTCEAPSLQCAASRWLGSRQGFSRDVNHRMRIVNYTNTIQMQPWSWPYKEKYLECTTWLEAALEPFHSANSVSHGGAVVDIRKLLKFVFPFSVFLLNVRLICHTADWCWPQKTDNSIVCAFNSLFETCSRRLQFKSYIQSQRILISAHGRLSVFNISCLWFPDTRSKDEEKVEEKLRKSEKTESKTETEEKAAVDQKLGSWELFLLHKAHRMSILWKALVIEWN